ncbi:MAG: phenylacetate--CoA ligase [Oscillospiraceae bacterium]|nr:phenylacetate--CoA ligase [Oscillospiraceae bacterium]
MKYWNQQIETISRDQLESLQSERLSKTVAHAWEHCAPYRVKMEKAGLQPGNIQGINDLTKLPLTLKDDLRDSYPYGMFAVPMSHVVRIHATSGTTGKQTVVGYTKGDLDVWNECMARCLTMAGATAADIVHVSYGFALFTGGLGGQGGGETIGAATIPAATGNTKRQLQMFTDFGSTVLLCTPSYAMYLGDAVREAGIKDQLKLRIGVLGAEAWTEQMRGEIEERLGIRCYDIFGTAELMGPGVSCECAERNGLHVMEDHFIVEILDPETKKPLPDGQPGELVFSCITKEALPLIRYNTRDICTIDRKPCTCGRNFTRMGKITGRTDDMLIIRGVNVFPSQVESVLLGIPGAAPHYLLVVDRVSNLDTLEVQAEINADFPFDEVRRVEELERRISAELLSVLGVSAKVTLKPPGSVERFELKAKRVLDKRKGTN